MTTHVKTDRCRSCTKLIDCEKKWSAVRLQWVDTALDQAVRGYYGPIKFKIIGIFEDLLFTDQRFPERKTRITHRLHQAYQAYINEDYIGALLMYKDIVSDGYYNWQAYFGLSLCFFYTEENDNALTSVDRLPLVIIGDGSVL